VTTVVLVGCSTAGKTSAVQRFSELYRNQFEVIDTDALVAAESEFKGHLYSMYLKFTQAENISAAQLYLEIGERHALNQFAQRRDSVLISAGPNLPFREREWTKFVEVVNPTCYYLRLNAEQLFEGLRRRRIRQRKRGLDMCSAFGCWDKGLATKYDVERGSWDELGYEEAIPLIEQHLERVDPIYLSLCKPENVFDGGFVRDNPQMQEQLAHSIFADLQKSPVPEPSFAGKSLSQLLRGYAAAVPGF
jgi:shikimate kinase